MQLEYTSHQRRLLHKHLSVLFGQEPEHMVEPEVRERLIHEFLRWFAQRCCRSETLQSACADLVSGDEQVYREWMQALMDDQASSIVYNAWHAITHKHEPTQEHQIIASAFKIMHDVMTFDLLEPQGNVNDRTGNFGQSLRKAR